MKYFDNKKFKTLKEHNFIDLAYNISAFQDTIKSAKTPYYSKRFNFALSLAIIPNIIKLIKSAIYFALSLTFCILTLGHFANMNKIAFSQFANMFVCVGNIALSLVVPFMRNYYTYKHDYGIILNDHNHNLRYDSDKYLKARIWQNKISQSGINENTCMLSSAERFVLGL